MNAEFQEEVNRAAQEMLRAMGPNSGVANHQEMAAYWLGVLDGLESSAAVFRYRVGYLYAHDVGRLVRAASAIPHPDIERHENHGGG